MKMKTRKHVAAFVLLLGVCAPAVSAETNALASAYQSNSPDAAQAFFEEWAQSSRPRSNEELAEFPAWQKDAYQIFENFHPRECKVSNTLYVVVQPSLQVVVDDWRTNQDTPIKHEIADFRPRFAGTNTTALFLSDDKKRQVVGFLDGATNVVTATADRPALLNEQRSRLQFLRPFVHVIHGHWGGWHIATHPSVFRLMLDSSRPRARLEFRMGYRGGEAWYETQDGRWVMRSSHLTWIE